MVFRRIALGLAVAIALAGISAGVAAQRGGGDPQAPAPVKVAAIVEVEAGESRTFIGTVYPTRQSIVSSEAAGKVESVFAEEGQRVEKGAPLVTLATTTLKYQIDAARAAWALRQDEFEELLNGSRKEDIDRVTAKVAGAQADDNYWTSRLESSAKLLASQTTSADEHAVVKRSAEKAKATLSEMKAELAVLVAGPRREVLNQAKARSEQAKAEVDRLDAELKKLSVSAPFGGWVTSKRTETGQWLAPGAAAFEIAELDWVDAVINVPEEASSQLTTGADARIEFNGLPGRLFTGRVHSVTPQASEKGRTFPVKVRLQNTVENGQPVIKAGMSASVTLALGAKRKALMCHKDAIVLHAGAASVWVVKTDGDKATGMKLPVEVGIAQDGMIEIRGESLSAGQQAVIRGNERLRAGQPLAVEGASGK